MRSFECCNIHVMQHACYQHVRMCMYARYVHATYLVRTEERLNVDPLIDICHPIVKATCLSNITCFILGICMLYQCYILQACYTHARFYIHIDTMAYSMYVEEYAILGEKHACDIHVLVNMHVLAINMHDTCTTFRVGTYDKSLTG